MISCFWNIRVYRTVTTVNFIEENSFENIVEKEENAGNQHFSFSHNVFYPIKDKVDVLHNN